MLRGVVEIVFFHPRLGRAKPGPSWYVGGDIDPLGGHHRMVEHGFDKPGQLAIAVGGSLKIIHHQDRADRQGMHGLVDQLRVIAAG